MKIHHIAIWAKDIEKMKAFYIRYFNCTSGNKYINHAKLFESYFLDFENGTRLEIMSIPQLKENSEQKKEIYAGINHFAISTGSQDSVNELTEKLKNDGYTIMSHPRRTGDGYFESVVLDPEGNRIEITE